MKKDDRKALESIAIETDEGKLLQWIRAGEREGSSAVVIAAKHRLNEVKPAIEDLAFEQGTLEYACWQMIYAVEAQRNLSRQPQ